MVVDADVNVHNPAEVLWRVSNNIDAQRDVLSLTLIEAALRDERVPLAKALAAERIQLKPASPFNWKLNLRAQSLEAAKLAA